MEEDKIQEIPEAISRRIFIDDKTGEKFIISSDGSVRKIGYHDPLTGTTLLNAGELEVESETQSDIKKICDQLKIVLLEKNKRYGDAALSPKNIFSKLSAGEQIKIRLDDKLSRIIASNGERKNDIFDLMGYLVLYCKLKGWTSFEDLID